MFVAMTDDYRIIIVKLGEVGRIRSEVQSNGKIFKRFTNLAAAN